ncbi:hypothetical protein [Povalibacter sp.]|uniref:hypothetical protein n=1 Tax=Povalibacter sp. TaxID=1962978 RepID=UPI002F402170
MKPWIVCVVLLLPVAGFACESGSRRRCEEQLMKLISYRADAIESAFGDLSGAMPEQLRVRFVRMKDPDSSMMTGHAHYDAERQMLLLSRRAVGATLPNPLRWAVYYWPYYQKEKFREDFPVIEAIDNAIWAVYLQSAARKSGLSWPHADCSSVEVAKRLPCEMVVTGIARFVKVRRPLHFNENRVDRIWPENFSAFNRPGLSYQDSEYDVVRLYGGISLVRPLISEFGVPQVLAYVAQIPFVIEGNNVRTSALHYQERARDALRAARIAPAAPRAPLLLAQVKEQPPVTRYETRVVAVPQKTNPADQSGGDGLQLK